jgi:hypothetical protein
MRFYKSDAYWEENRFENLNKDEKRRIQMLDTLKRSRSLRSCIICGSPGSGYMQIGILIMVPFFLVLAQ